MISFTWFRGERSQVVVAAWPHSPGEVLTGGGFKNPILAHVEILRSVDLDKLPYRFLIFSSLAVTLVQLATRFVPRFAGGTILLMKTHPLGGRVSLVQCLLPDELSQAR
jgi:hypothetical protein